MQVKWKSLINEVQSTGDAYLLAVSGGVDSVFMLNFFAKNANKPLRVAHFNHGLRDQANDEEALIRDLCRKHDIPVSVGYGDPDKMRASDSLEGEARAQRYAFFTNLRQENELLVTAHHANDQLETIILRMMRGYPHDNLVIRKRAGYRYRPFLAIPKETIVGQATKQGLTWMEDESNADTVHERNWVRHEVIPLMSERRNVLRSMVLSPEDRGQLQTAARR